MKSLLLLAATAALFVAGSAVQAQVNSQSSIQAGPGSSAACETFSDPTTVCTFDHFTGGEELTGTIGNLGWRLTNWISESTGGCGMGFSTGAESYVYYNSPALTDPAGGGDPSVNKHPGTLGGAILSEDTGFGFVTGIAINDPGTGYLVNDVLTIDAGDTNATLTVDAINGGGGITAFTLTCSGSSYLLSVNTLLTGGAGVDATVDVTNVIPGYVSAVIDTPAATGNLPVDFTGTQFYPGDSSWTARFMFLPSNSVLSAGTGSQFVVGIQARSNIPIPPIQLFPDPLDFAIGGATFFYIDLFNHSPSGSGTVTWHFRNEWDTAPPVDVDTGIVGVDYDAVAPVPVAKWRLFELRKVKGEALIHYRIYDEDGVALMADTTAPYRPVSVGAPYQVSSPFAVTTSICICSPISEDGFLFDDYRLKWSSQ